MLGACLFLLFSLQLARSACPYGCRCTTVLATCENVGVEPVSLNLDLTLRDYNFTGNKVGVLDKNLYSRLEELQYLLLRKNRITEIADGIFDHNRALRRVDLSYNQIKTLPANLFQKNTQLREFYCEANILTTIDAKLFRGLTHLRELMLENNQLTKIPPEAFSTNRMLSRLYLEENLLQTAYWDWISHFNHSRKHDYELYLDQNPWSCDCRMEMFKLKITSHKWTSSTGKPNGQISLPKCHDIPGKTPVSITDVDVEKFVCKSPKLTHLSNCSLNGSSDIPCRIKFKEGTSGKILCKATGKPLPKVQIKLKSGAPLTPQAAGHAEISWNAVIAGDAADYVCVVRGFSETGAEVVLKQSVTVVVETVGSPAVGIILGVLFAAFIVLGGYVIYRYKFRNRAGYGSLGDKYDAPVHFDVNHQPDSQVTYLQDDDGNDDYAGEDEKEVLV